MRIKFSENRVLSDLCVGAHLSALSVFVRRRRRDRQKAEGERLVVKNETEDEGQDAKGERRRVGGVRAESGRREGARRRRKNCAEAISLRAYCVTHT